ncbi:MAG: BON domain-containing protein [Proteobacteria bacterium]|nr:BON domain-containing protein [Pseudomonadota bacterium]
MREDISERLMQSYDIDSSEVTVQVQGGKVTLEGTVPSRHMKHMIEDIADSAAGVQDVDNRIHVASSATRWGGNQDAGALGQNANNPVASGTGSTTSTTSSGRSGSSLRRDS